MKSCLETKTKQGIRPCLICGEEYNLQARLQKISKKPKPNSAADYCSDPHWAIGTAMLESA